MRSLRAWCECVLALVGEGAQFDHWQQDPAGREVLGLLEMEAPGREHWHRLMLDHVGFRAWLTQSLDGLRWQPTLPSRPHVVVTPLRQAVMRSFAATVLPGADHVRLRPAGPAPPGQPADALRETLGLPARHDRARLEAQAFVMLLRTPRLTLIRRNADGDEPMSTAPWVLRWQAERRRCGGDVPPLLSISMPTVEHPARPTLPPLPTAGGPLPPALSVSALAALRECPYKFHARVRLGLAAWPELETPAGARDHGDWLHALLLRWHDQRAAPASIDTEVEVMLDLARDTSSVDSAIDDDLWPQRALLDEFARRYVAWQHQRDAAGWRYLAGEQPRRIPLGDLEGVELRGTLDRIDEHRATGQPRQRQLLDYKSGRLERYKRLASQPLEDTQLALYGALEGGADIPGDSMPLAAGYVVLGDPAGIALTEHAEVAASSAITLRQMASELRRVMAGAAMPALGGAQECRVCDYDGLCRREEWSADAVDAIDGDDSA
ncbi:MAG: RecB family exonuclease [Aquabacterium sp.]